MRWDFCVYCPGLTEIFSLDIIKKKQQEERFMKDMMTVAAYIYDRYQREYDEKIDEM